MGDNHIRIPPSEYLNPSIEKLLQQYECYQSPNDCSLISVKAVPKDFVLSYQKATQEMLDGITVPVARDSKFYLVSTSPSGEKKTAQEICENTADVLFDDVLDSAQNEGPIAVDTAMPHLHDAVYWARRAGMNEDDIQAKILEIQRAYEEWFQLNPPPTPEEALKKPPVEPPPPPPPPEPPPPPPPPSPQTYFSLSPLLSYEVTSTRSYAGLGVAGEILKPLKPESPWVAGGEIEALMKLGYDDPSLFGGELKTIEAVSFPLYLETGYRGESTTVLLQGGVWFAYSHLSNAEHEDDAYSKQPLQNPHLRLGAKTYVVDNRLRLSTGYQKSPWGSGAYVEMGYHFDLKKEKL